MTFVLTIAITHHQMSLLHAMVRRGILTMGITKITYIPHALCKSESDVSLALGIIYVH